MDMTETLQENGQEKEQPIAEKEMPKFDMKEMERIIAQLDMDGMKRFIGELKEVIRVLHENEEEGERQFKAMIEKNYDIFLESLQLIPFGYAVRAVVQKISEAQKE